MPDYLGRLAITNHDDEIGLFVFFDLNFTDMTQRRRTVVPPSLTALLSASITAPNDRKLKMPMA